MKLTDRIMENTLAYRLWQAPISEQKFAPVHAHNDLKRVRRVLDVGCGPGMNTHHFAGADYLGIDWNEKYIEIARRHHKRNFMVADVTKYSASPDERFDFILVNNVLHHIDTPNTSRILSHLSTLLTDEGYIHVLDIMLPARPSIARFLARMDRGKFPRPVEEWRALVEEAFEPVVFEPFTLRALGATLWEVGYFKGRAKR